MKVVLVTGAAGGLGRGLVTAFLAAGWRVAAGLHCAGLGIAHDHLLEVPLDVTDSAQAEAAVRKITTRWGRLDALVNNAGITANHPLWRMQDADWDRVIDVNLHGVARITRAALHPMLAQGDGHVLTIGSFVGRTGAAGQSAYAAAKAGVVGFTRSLAREMGGQNIRANVVLPGVLTTPMTSGLSEERLAELIRENVLGRPSSLEEVTGFMVFLAGLHNVSGQVFQLDSRIAPGS